MGGRRRLGGRVDTLLTAVAVGLRIVRTLDANESIIGFRSADGCSMFSWDGCGMRNTAGAFIMLRSLVRRFRPRKSRIMTGRRRIVTSRG